MCAGPTPFNVLDQPVNNSFLLPKQTAPLPPLKRAHTQYGHSRCPAAADCGADYWVWKVLHSQTAADNTSQLKLCWFRSVWLCSGTERPSDVRPICSCQSQLGFLGLWAASLGWELAPVSRNQTSFGSGSPLVIGPVYLLLCFNYWFRPFFRRPEKSLVHHQHILSHNE